MASFAANLYEGVQLAEALRVKRGALKFTNTSGQLRMPTGPSSGSVFSFCTWMKITTDTNNYALWLSLQGASTTYWEAGTAIDGTSAIVADAGFERAIGPNFTVGTWYFFGVTHAAGTVKVYTGSEGGTLTETSTTLANLVLPLSEKLFGGELSNEPLSGAMSEVRGWNATLTRAEMFAEFRSETQVRTSNSLGYWKMESSASKTTDSSGNSNTLTNPQGTGTWATEPGPRVDGAPTADLYENIGMAEVLDTVYTGSGGSSYTGNVSETVTLSEALGAVLAAVAGLAETVTLSEAAAALYGAVAGLAETVTLSEAASTVAGAAAACAETVTLSEALAALAGAVAALSETVGLSESVAAGTAFTGGVNEDVGAVGESLGAQFGAITNIAEQVDILEVLGALVGSTVGVAESVMLSELLAAVAGAQAALAETVTLSELIVAGTAFTGNVNESVGAIGESLATQRGAVVPVDETVTLSESLAALAAAVAAIQETVGWTESVTTGDVEDVIALLAELRETAWRVAVAAKAYAVASVASAHSVTLKERNVQIIEGTRARLEATFTDPDGARYDPTTPTLVVVDTDGTETTYTSPTVVHDTTTNEVGDYYCDVLFAAEGTAHYAWRSTASGEETVGEGKVRVLPSSL